LNSNDTDTPIKLYAAIPEKIISDHMYKQNKLGVNKGFEVAKVLPAISILPNTPQDANNYKMLKAQQIILDGIQYTPVPKMMEYTITLMAHKIDTIMDMIESAQVIFDGGFSVDIEYHNDIKPLSTQMMMSSPNLNLNPDYGVDELRVVSFEFNISFIVYIYKSDDIYNSHDIVLRTENRPK